MAIEYQPRILPRNREYPGYQFYAALRHASGDADRCFCFAVLCVIDWLKKRLAGTDVVPPEIRRLPGRDHAEEITPADLLSFTISSGFSAYVVSLPEHRIWSLRLKEPDSDTEQRKAVPGRFFATNIGIRVLKNGQVELGIRIDVTDPEGTPEVDYAFRPNLLRSLFESPEITLAQVTDLLYQKAIKVNDEAQLKALRTILDSSQGMMPVIVFTEAVRLPKLGFEPVSLLMKSPPPSSVFDNPPIDTPAFEYSYPFDADDFASHAFGYANKSSDTDLLQIYAMILTA